jgi:hypothetical protein
MSSVRFICGTQDIHKTLERKISEFYGTEDTILYAAAFDANGGVFEPLLGEKDAIISIGAGVEKVEEEKMERDIEIKKEQTTKHCCKENQQVKCVCHCCLRTWSLSLKVCRSCCTFSSAVCIFMSTLAIGCNKNLEQMDCDGN